MENIVIELDWEENGHRVSASEDGVCFNTRYDVDLIFNAYDKFKAHLKDNAVMRLSVCKLSSHRRNNAEGE